MGSKLNSIEFDTNNSSIKAKIEYMTVNHSPYNLQSGLLVFLYLKNTNAQTGTVYTDNATFSLSSGTKKADFIKNSFLSVPYIDGQKWCKVGVVSLNGFVHTKNNSKKTTSCSLDLKLTGTTTGIDFGAEFNSRIELDSLYLGRLKENVWSKAEAHPSFFDTTLSNMTLGETKSFKIQKNWANVIQKIRYFWGDSRNDYNCFFVDSSCEEKLQSDDGILSGINDEFVVGDSDTGGNQTYYFNLLKGDTEYNELTRVNQVLCRDPEKCVIILESYIGLTKEYLGNRVLLVDVKLPSKYKPAVAPGTIEIINNNDIVKGWNIALQSYSRAKTSCNAVVAVPGDDAQIVKYEISIKGGSSATQNEVETDIFRTSGTKTFVYKATDSRGRTAEATKTLTVHPYFLPEVSFAELYRCDESGAKTDKGRWLCVKPLSYFASCNKNNQVSFKCWWKKTSDETYDETHSATVPASGLRINANLDETLSYDIKVRITDSLGAYTESITFLTSGRVLLHFNIGGNSLGIGIYNYDENTCKIGYDLLLSEVSVNEYIEKIIKNYDVSKGTIDSGGGKYYQRESDTYVDFTNISWKYEKYHSGKVELWGRCKITDLKPDKTNTNYVYLFLDIPKVDDKPIVKMDTHDLVYVGGVSDNLALLSKGDADGYNNGFFSFLFYRISAWTTLTPTVDFHITAIPK